MVAIGFELTALPTVTRSGRVHLTVFRESCKAEASDECLIRKVERVFERDFELTSSGNAVSSVIKGGQASLFVVPLDSLPFGSIPKLLV